MVLPVEGSTVVVQAGPLDDLETVGPLGQALQPLRFHGHIVIHDPEPLCAKTVGLAHTGRVPAGTTTIVLLRKVDHPVLTALTVHDGLPPESIDLLGECLNHLPGPVGILIVHHNNPPGGDGLAEDGLEKIGQEFLPFVGHDDHGDLVYHFFHASIVAPPETEQASAAEHPQDVLPAVWVSIRIGPMCHWIQRFDLHMAHC